MTEEEIWREIDALQKRIDELRRLLPQPSEYQGMQTFTSDGKTVVLIRG